MEKLLRTEAEVALDDVVESCKAAADHYHGAFDVAPPELRELFERFERQRREWAGELEDQVRRMGNLPSAPDADREALDQFVTRVKVALSRDEHAALVERALKVEEELAHRAAAARRENLPPAVRALLGEIEAGAGSARRELTAG